MTDTPMPLVSIVIPCYNYGNYLNYTLQKILTQNYSNWECILVDDGSTDNTAAVAKKYAASDRRFQYIFQKNSGPAVARNTGISISKGKYIQFLDSDDLIHEDKIKLQVRYLEHYPEIDLVYGNAMFFNTNDPPDERIGNAKRGKYSHLKISGGGQSLIRNFCFNNFIEISCPLLRKNLVDKIGLFDEAYFIFEDWQYWFRLACSGANFAYSPLVGTETYISHGHKSLLGNIKKCALYGIKIRKFMMPYLTPKLKIYNAYRLLKLYTKSLLLKFTTP